MVIPTSLAELKARVRGLLQHTRDIEDDELLTAINFGYRKAIKAVLATRPEAFVSYTDGFAIQTGVTEYDVGTYDPPIWRPLRLLAGETDASQAQAYFRYKAMTDQEFQALDMGGRSAGLMFYYDFLSGMLPGDSTTVASATTGSIDVADLGDFAVGTYIGIVGAGPRRAVGGETIPGPWRGVITGITGVTCTIEPDFTAIPSNGAAVQEFRTRVLKITPPPSQSYTGRLYYNYRPQRLTQDTDLLDVLIAEHDDLIVWYALAIVGRAVGDTNAAKWFDDAEGQRSELMQDLDPIGQQGGSEDFGSDLMGMEDW